MTALLPSSIGGHARHHGRFYLAMLAGLAVGAFTWGLDWTFRLVLAGDVFFAAYLLLTAWATAGATPATMRRRATSEDEGIALIALITLSAIALSLVSLITMLGGKEQPGPVHLTLTFISVPLGWATLHTVLAFHYAHRFYRRRKDGGHPGDAGGLDFPKTEEPLAGDFLYYSFVVGMTAQVSDVDVTSSRMRRLTLVHSVISFFFNTVIVALAVSTLAGQGH